MVYGKITKGLPPLSRTKLSKTPQDKDDEIKKIHEANRHWNDRKFQLRWNKLEWVNQRSINKRKQHYSVSSNIFLLINILEQLIGLDVNYQNN